MTAWNEALHPRVPAGSPEGGEFTSLSAVEARIRDAPIEYGAAFDPKTKRIIGKVVKGNETGVYLTTRFMNRLRGQSFLHNHPSGYPPSVLDIVSASRLNLRELRVVGPEYTYSVTRAAGRRTWPSAESIRTLAGTAWQQPNPHRALSAIAPQLGLKYTRKETGSPSVRGSIFDAFAANMRQRLKS